MIKVKKITMWFWIGQIRYFDKNFFKSFPLNEKIWNYNISLLYFIDNHDDIFFTNNLIETINRILNNKYKGICKTFYNFEYAKNELFKYFDNKSLYKERNVSYTKALTYYARITNVTNLITKKELNKIYNDYKKTFINRRELIKESEYDSDSDDNFITVKDNINFRNGASSNYNSNFSDSSLDKEDSISEESHDKRDDRDSSSSGDDNSNNDNYIFI